MGSLQPCHPLGPCACWLYSPVQPVGRGSAAAGCCPLSTSSRGLCGVPVALQPPARHSRVVLGSSLPRACCELPLPFVSVWSGLRWDFFQKLEQLGDCGKVVLREADCTGLIGRGSHCCHLTLADTAGASLMRHPRCFRTTRVGLVYRCSCFIVRIIPLMGRGRPSPSCSSPGSCQV